MVRFLTIDSCVFVAYFYSSDSHHSQAVPIIEDLLNSDCYAILPYSVLVEVTAAIKRRTGDIVLAQEVFNKMRDLNSIIYVNLTEKRAKSASELAIGSSLRGMDAIVIQVSREYKSELISFDTEITNFINNNSL